MATNSCLVWKVLLASSYLAWLSVLAQAQCQDQHWHPPGFYDFQVAARSAVFGPFIIQANNGQVLDQTLWNHHYLEGTDDLHSSGFYVLDRLARRNNGEMLELHLQTARDLEYNRKNADKYQKFREGLDFKRVQAIVDYMRGNHPNITFTVRVIDPAPVGMSGIEAGKALIEVNNTAKGVLPPELTQGLGNYLRSLTGNGGGGDASAPPPPSPISAGTSGTSGTFGSQATQGGPSGP